MEDPEPPKQEPPTAADLEAIRERLERLQRELDERAPVHRDPPPDDAAS